MASHVEAHSILLSVGRTLAGGNYGGNTSVGKHWPICPFYGAIRPFIYSMTSFLSLLSCLVSNLPLRSSLHFKFSFQPWEPKSILEAQQLSFATHPGQIKFVRNTMSTSSDPAPFLDEKQHASPPSSTNNSLPDTNESSNTDGALAEKGPEATEPPVSPRPVKGVLWALVVVAILSSTFLFSLDNTVVADVQPTIVRQFGSVNKLTWLSVGYLLGSTTTNLLWYVLAFCHAK